MFFFFPLLPSSKIYLSVLKEEWHRGSGERQKENEYLLFTGSFPGYPRELGLDQAKAWRLHAGLARERQEARYWAVLLPARLMSGKLSQKWKQPSILGVLIQDVAMRQRVV